MKLFSPEIACAVFGISEKEKAVCMEIVDELKRAKLELAEAQKRLEELERMAQEEADRSNRR